MNDSQLEVALVSAVARERAAEAEVLRLLREVERRRLFLARGYSSLFAYCTEKLGYSEQEAMLRINSMRLARVAPAALERIESGELSMSVAAQIQTASRREKLKPEETKALVIELSGSSKREAERVLAAKFPSPPKAEKTKPISEDLVEIRFTVTREEAELLEKLLDRKAHSNFERSKAKLFVELARAALQKLEGNPAQDATPQRPGRVRTRYIPAQTKREIWRRDQARCQYTDPQTGKKCEATHALQLDHIHPYAQQGPNTEENLRLLCGAHNRARTHSTV